VLYGAMSQHESNCQGDTDQDRDPNEAAPEQ
jgi:hypothetical protein